MKQVKAQDAPEGPPEDAPPAQPREHVEQQLKQALPNSNNSNTSNDSNSKRTTTTNNNNNNNSNSNSNSNSQQALTKHTWRAIDLFHKWDKSHDGKVSKQESRQDTPPPPLLIQVL